MSTPGDRPAETLLMQQAYEQLQDGRFEDAVETFSASLLVGPHDADARRGRGLAYLQLKRWALAAADFAAARDLAPDDADNWIDLGVSLAMDNKIYPAIEALETLLATQPDCERGHLTLGMLHLTLGAIPKGRAELERALACRPTREQRRFIESMLHEQSQLDRKRFYRPDFEALHRQHALDASTSLTKRLRQWCTRRWGRRASEHS